jgi:hypothetical protein
MRHIMSVRRSGDIGELNTLVYVSLVANNVGWLLYGLVMKVSTVFGVHKCINFALFLAVKAMCRHMKMIAVRSRHRTSQTMTTMQCTGWRSGSQLEIASSNPSAQNACSKNTRNDGSKMS